MSELYRQRVKISYQIFSCLPTSLESQGSSRWLRHRRNENPCFRGSLERWGRSSTLRAHPETPLLPPPLPPLPCEEGANRRFPDPLLVCPREGAALASPFPTHPAGRQPGALAWFTSPPERSLQNPAGGEASHCVWERRGVKRSRRALHFSLQRTVSSTILCCSAPPSFPDWQQRAHRWTRCKMKTQVSSPRYKGGHTENREGTPRETATAFLVFCSSDAGK